jgi:hypothetical protein
MKGISLTVLVPLSAFLLSSQPAFEDIAAQSGAAFRNEPSQTPQKYLPETMVGGVALFDYNSDGLLDLFFVNGAALTDPMPEGQQPTKSEPQYWNRLYRQKRDGSFTDVTAEAGVAGYLYGQGVAVGDYDNDGHPDLYVTNFGRNILYRNNGDGTFEDATAQAGVAGGGWSTGAMFVDYDADGFLDLAVARYLDWDFTTNRWCGERKEGYRAYCHPNEFGPVTHLLFHNNGDGTFADVSRSSGFGRHPGKGLGVAFNDFDRDGRPDIFVANDSFPQQLFRNLGDGAFEEKALVVGVGFDEDGRTFAGMGIDFVDYDNDGWPDVFVNALARQKYALYRNHGGIFDYVSGPTGVASATQTHSGWGTKLIDYDNDGWKDIFVAQGHVMDNVALTQPDVRYREPFLLMRNIQGTFTDVSKQGGPDFQVERAARGAAFGDLNNDGFVDIVVNCNAEPAVILRNMGNGNHWLMIDTVGTVSNRDGIGAQIRLVAESGAEQFGLVSTAGSYLSASDKRVHFGLGAETKAKLVEITWPSGVVQRIENVSANQMLIVTEPKP